MRLPRRPLNNPNSVTRPHPPILIGGAGEKITLAMALAPGESADSFVQRCRVARERGFDHVGLITRGTPWTEETVATVSSAVDGA